MAYPRLTFHGAARTVTGSCFRLETDRGQILIDCGLFQGSKTEKELNYRPFPFPAKSIDAVILSHAHIDHSGLLPKLTRDGFAGPVYATSATADLAGVMLPDSAHIQEYEVEQLNRRSARRHGHMVDPIYSIADAKACLEQFQSKPYDTWFDVLPMARARFWNAGHLLGSTSVEVEIAGEDTPMRVLFSADIGPNYKLLQPDPTGPGGVDYLICEATYGDRDREEASSERRRELLADEVREAMHPHGALLIPSFAVERAQELISDLSRLIADKVLPTIPIYIDSPLASRATRVFASHAGDLEDGPKLLQGLKSRNLKFTESKEDSMALDDVQGFHIVIAASGMCEAGRIRHRLKNWLWRHEATVLLVGYQAEGTLGRILQNGVKTVRIQGDEFAVRARIRSLDMYSGHADATELVDWIRARLPLRHDLFLVHGEAAAIDAFASRLVGTVPADHILRPVLDETFELTPKGVRRLSVTIEPRLPPEKLARLDWHNDVSRLILNINDALAATADDRTRDVVIRRLQRALEEDDGQTAKHATRH